MTARGNLTLRNLTLTGGAARGFGDNGSGGASAGLGGAIYNQGTLDISGCTLTGNSAVGGSSRVGFRNKFFKGAELGGAGLGSSPYNPNPDEFDGKSFTGLPNAVVNTPDALLKQQSVKGFGSGGAFGYSLTSKAEYGGNGGFGAGGGAGDVGGNGGFGRGGGAGAFGRMKDLFSNRGKGGPGGFGGAGTNGENGADFSGSGGGGGAGLGGALFNQGGTVTLTNSTITGNFVRGGNVTVLPAEQGYAGGAGIFNLNGSLTLNGVTISNNLLTPGSGAITFINADAGALYNCAIEGGNATVFVTNSILANSVYESSTSRNLLLDVVNFQVNGTASITATGPNIVTRAALFSGGSAMSGTPFTVADPNLGPLAKNGGFTQTMLPNAGSPAIDKGSNTAFTGLTTDQRGGSFVRIFNGTVDIGAVEVQPASAPVVIAPTSLPAGQVGTAYNQTITATGPAGPFTFAVTTGSLPVGLTLSSSGLLSGTPTTSVASSFTVTATGPALAVGIQTYIVTINLLSPPVLVGYKQFGVGQDVGGSMATLYNPDKSVRFSLTSFGSFTGGVRTTSADFNGDGVADLVVGTGPGRATQVVVLDGVTQKQLFTVDPFEATFTGGVYVAAGDLNGDGFADLAITPDEGNGPRARVFNGKGFTQIADFFGIDDAKFRGGARAAIGNITGDGNADLVIAAGFGGGPRVAVFSGVKLASEGGLADQNAARWNSWKPFGDFLTFEAALRNGAFVAVGDLNGDGFAELVAGGGPGGGPRVTAFSGKGLLSNTQTPLANFFGGDVNNRGGVRVSVKNLDGDDLADVVVGSGAGAGSRVTAYAGKSIGASTPPELFGFDAMTGFSSGVFVG